jgi:hypothetical protein
MPAGFAEVFLIGVAYIAPLLICAWLAPQKRRGPTWLWLLLAIVFSWLAVLVLAVLRPSQGVSA